MLKRITESYTTATIDEINEEGDYAIPTADERENPGVPWEDVVKKRDLQNAFQGDFKCNLCPKKILRTKADLAEHLQSKKHKKNLAKFFKKNKEKLKRQMTKIKKQVERRYLFTMPKFQKLVRLGIHYKLLS